MVLIVLVLDAGFMYDREWMLVSANNGRLIAMARAPKLALVQPSLPAAAFRGETMPHNAVMGKTFIQSLP